MQESNNLDRYNQKWATLRVTESVRWLNREDRPPVLVALGAFSAQALLGAFRASWVAHAVLAVLAGYFFGVLIWRNHANRLNRKSSAKSGGDPCP